MAKENIMFINPTADIHGSELKQFESSLKRSNWDQSCSTLQIQIAPIVCNGTKENVHANVDFFVQNNATYLIVHPKMGEDALYLYFDYFSHLIQKHIIPDTTELFFYNYFIEQTTHLVPYFSSQELKHITRNYNLTLFDYADEITTYIYNTITRGI